MKKIMKIICNKVKNECFKYCSHSRPHEAYKLWMGGYCTDNGECYEQKEDNVKCMKISKNKS